MNFSIQDMKGTEKKVGSLNIVKGKNKIAISFEELASAQYKLLLSVGDEQEILVLSKVESKGRAKARGNYF